MKSVAPVNTTGDPEEALVNSNEDKDDDQDRVPETPPTVPEYALR